jgi:hypothetical protein
MDFHSKSWANLQPFRANPETFVLMSRPLRCEPSCDMCVKNRSTSVIEAAIEKAAALGCTRHGWLSLFAVPMSCP